MAALIAAGKQVPASRGGKDDNVPEVIKVQVPVSDDEGAQKKRLPIFQPYPDQEADAAVVNARAREAIEILHEKVAASLPPLHPLKHGPGTLCRLGHASTHAVPRLLTLTEQYRIRAHKTG